MKKILGILIIMQLMANDEAQYCGQFGQDRYLNEEIFKNKKYGIFC